MFLERVDWRTPQLPVQDFYQVNNSDGEEVSYVCVTAGFTSSSVQIKETFQRYSDVIHLHNLKTSVELLEQAYAYWTHSLLGIRFIAIQSLLLVIIVLMFSQHFSVGLVAHCIC